MNLFQRHSLAFGHTCKEHLELVKDGANLKHLLFCLLLFGVSMFLTGGLHFADSAACLVCIALSIEGVLATFQLGAFCNPPVNGQASNSIELFVPLGVLSIAGVLCFTTGALQTYLLACGILLIWTLLVIFRGRTIRPPVQEVKEEISQGAHTLA